MNCLEFRRLCLTHCTVPDGTFVEHRNTCPECAEFAQQIMDFDRQLSNALRIEVPDELASRIKLQQVIGDEQRTRIQRVKMYAMAATLVLSIGLSAMLGFTLHQQTGRNEMLSHAVIQHINSELYHLTEQRDVQLASLNKILLPLGARVEQGFGRINYAGRCLINDKPGAHLVLPGEIVPLSWL